MKLLNSKVVSCESETVEYNSFEEFNEDKSKRRKDHWNITKAPNWYFGSMDEVIKTNNGKLIIKWVRYGGIPIG